MFEASRGFKPIDRSKEAPLTNEPQAPEAATGLHSVTQKSPDLVDKKENLLISGNKLRGFTVAKMVNGVETDSHTFPNLEILKSIISQDGFKGMEIVYRVSNEDEANLRATLDPKPVAPAQPEEEPLGFEFQGQGTANLLNQRGPGDRTYVSPREKMEIKQDVAKAIKLKLMDKRAMAKEIKELKKSNVVNSISSDYLNGNVFLDNVDVITNLTRYVRYMIYDELVNHMSINPETKIIRSDSDVRKRGGDLSPVIKELAKELTPLFERILNRKEKSELFNAFQVA